VICLFGLLVWFTFRTTKARLVSVLHRVSFNNFLTNRLIFITIGTNVTLFLDRVSAGKFRRRVDTRFLLSHLSWGGYISSSL
jgi:hypothetical protein